VRRLVLVDSGPPSDRDAARVLDRVGGVVATVAEPTAPGDVGGLRDAVIAAVLDEDFGDVVLAGVAFAPRWGGDAVAFT
jgi:hypothetical protein